MRTIARFTKAEDAHNLRAFLEGSGLTAFVRDENIIGADPLVANAIGGVRVDVEDESFLRARELYSAVQTSAPVIAIPRHPMRRYVKFFAVCVPLALLILLMRGSNLFVSTAYVGAFLEAIAISLVAAAMGALLNV